MDYILNGQAHGNAAAQLLDNNFDLAALRPWIDKDGKHYCQVLENNARRVVRVANATLRKDEWIELDRQIVEAYQVRLRAVTDLRSRGLQYTVPDGLSKTVLQTERQSDINGAILSMDGTRESERDRPLFDIVNLPLPIVHKDFSFSARQLAASRKGGSPLDMTTARLAARQCAEQIEELLLGVATGITYGGGTIYGYTNFPNRNTRTITLPTAGGWTPATALDDVLAMRSQAYGDNQFGPYVLYCSPNWDQYMDDDFSSAKGDNTLRQRLKMIEGIEDVRTLDKLTGYSLVLVQMQQDTARMVVGAEITTVQWESKGGMQVNFKVMGILVPQVRADYDGRCGIVHGSG